MTPTNDQPPPDYTPEQKAKILAEMKKRFTVEDLIGYIEDDDEKYPAEQVLGELEEIVRESESRPERGQ